MKKILILKLIGLTILGCASDDYNLKETEYAAYIIENSIDVDISFMPDEMYDNPDAPQSPDLILRLTTVKDLPCIGYGLIISPFMKENELIVRFDGISTPGGACLSQPWPASSYVDLPENVEKITFINGDRIDKYAIEVKQDKISILPVQSSFTNSLYDQTFRRPENSFAYVCATNTNSINVYDNFFEILKQNPDFIQFEFEGEGRIPYPESSDGSGSSVNHPSKFFKYSTVEEFDRLANVLYDYAAEHIEENAGVKISIYGWNNKIFHSWTEN